MLDSLSQMVTGVGLITTFTRDRGANVMSAEWTMLVSHSPPQIIVVVRKSAATHGMIRESGEFGVSMAAEGQADIVSLAGSFTGTETDKFSSTIIKTRAAKRIRAPMIEGAAMNAECVLRQTVDFGEYVGFVGEVVEATHDPQKSPLAFNRHHLSGLRDLTRPKILYVTGTRDDEANTVRAEGRIRAEGAGEVSLVLKGGQAISKTPVRPDKWGFYEHEWPAEGGEFTVEAEGAGMSAEAVVGAGR